jgi:hypothetical protein
MMEDMELLKAMLVKMNPIMKYNLEMMKSNQEKVEDNRKSDQEDFMARLEAKIETDREDRKAERKAYQEELKKMMEGMLRDKEDARLAEMQDG